MKILQILTAALLAASIIAPAQTAPPVPTAPPKVDPAILPKPRAARPAIKQQAKPTPPSAPPAAPPPSTSPIPRSGSGVAPPHDYSQARKNLQHALEDVGKDIQLDTMALQNLQEFGDYISKQQQVRNLQQQMENLNQQEAAERAAAASQPPLPEPGAK